MEPRLKLHLIGLHFLWVTLPWGIPVCLRLGRQLSHSGVQVAAASVPGHPGQVTAKFGHLAAWQPKSCAINVSVLLLQALLGK